jgi:hypothetical protein
MLRSIVALAGTVLLVGASARSAQAMTDDEVVKAHVPFAFQVEGTHLPAGDYVLKPLDINTPGAIEIRSVTASGPAAAFLTVPEDSGSATQPRLLFDDVGNQHFLRGILVPGQTGAEVPVPDAEVMAARDVAAQSSGAASHRR